VATVGWMEIGTKAYSWHTDETCFSDSYKWPLQMLVNTMLKDESRGEKKL
jgi:hypothetical protein